MEQLFVIKMTIVFRHEKLGENKWNNIYLVKTEKKARECCVMHQVKANSEYSNMYKVYYMYEKLDLY